MDSNWITVITTICGLIVSVASASAIVAKIVTKAIKKVSAETIKEELSGKQASTDESLKSLTEDIRSLSNQLSEFCSNQKDVNEQLKQSLLASTRDRINQAHDFYCKRKFIGTHTMFVLEELYASYKSLGGNSFITRQMEDLRELEVRSAETVTEEEIRDE